MDRGESQVVGNSKRLLATGLRLADWPVGHPPRQATPLVIIPGRRIRVVVRSEGTVAVRAPRLL